MTLCVSVCMHTRVHTCYVCKRRRELSGHHVGYPGLAVPSPVGGIPQGLSAVGRAGSQQHSPLSRRPSPHRGRDRDRAGHRHPRAWLSQNGALGPGQKSQVRTVRDSEAEQCLRGPK